MSRQLTFGLVVFLLLAFLTVSDINPSAFPKFERVVAFCAVLSASALVALVFGERDDHP
jgi:uncharacterized protein YacL